MNKISSHVVLDEPKKRCQNKSKEVMTLQNTC